MSKFDVLPVLIAQSKEIAEAGIPGWGNTMLFAAEEIERLRAALSVTREGVAACEEGMK